MIQNKNYLSFEIFSGCKNLINFVSTRSNGNLSYSAGNGRMQKDLENFLRSSGIEPDSAVFAEQVHEDRIEKIDDIRTNTFIKHGVKIVKGADALITDKKRICVSVKTADCVPLILFDKEKNAVAVVHAGWRGTLKNIAGKTVRTFESIFGSDPSDILVAIGPYIAAEHFLIRSDVEKYFSKHPIAKKIIRKVSVDQWQLDLGEINFRQLIKEGIKPENIQKSGISTYSSDNFFSYRKKEPAGHFISGALLT